MVQSMTRGILWAGQVTPTLKTNCLNNYSGGTFLEYGDFSDSSRNIIDIYFTNISQVTGTSGGIHVDSVVCCKIVLDCTTQWWDD
jgi:hypothetical protein